MSDTFFSESKPVARKTHRCGLCGLDIAPGTKHIARRGISDNRPYTFRMHFACEKITQSWDEIDWESGWDEVEFRTMLEPPATP